MCVVESNCCLPWWPRLTPVTAACAHGRSREKHSVPRPWDGSSKPQDDDRRKAGELWRRAASFKSMSNRTHVNITSSQPYAPEVCLNGNKLYNGCIDALEFPSSRVHPRLKNPSTHQGRQRRTSGNSAYKQGLWLPEYLSLSPYS